MSRAVPKAFGMRVDAHAEHTQGLDMLDEAHPVHVGGEVVHLIGALQGAVAVVLLPQVEGPVVRLRKLLEPLVGRLDVDGAHLIVALLQQVRHEVAASAFLLHWEAQSLCSLSHSEDTTYSAR
jgi:hypothetical protein